MRFRVLVLIGCLLFVCGVAEPQQKKPKPQVGALKKDLGKIKSKKKDIQAKLKATRGKVRQVKGDIHQLDVKINDVSSALVTTTNRLSDNRQKQTVLAGELIQATQQLDITREQVRKRLRWMYTHEGDTALASLIMAKDVSEVASRSYLLDRIAKADRKLFNEYIALRHETADKKRQQDALVIEIAGLKHDQEGQKAELADTREDKSYSLGQLIKTQKDLERLLRKLDAEEASIAARIATYYAGAGKTSGLKPFTGRFSRPVSGPITSRFGMRFHPILKRNRMHAGIDFGAGRGAPIHAAAEGIVILSTYSQGYGNQVVIDHGGGISTLYGHCSKILVSAGQRITRGETIALVGSTGLATGPHLHFEVRVNGRPVNPLGRL